MPKTAMYRYETDNGNCFKIRADADAVLDAVRGASSPLALTENMTVKMSKNDNEVGISPRYALFGRSIGTESPATIGLTDTATRYKKVAVFTTDSFALIVTGKIGDASVTNFTQNGATYYALNLVDEDIN